MNKKPEFDPYPGAHGPRYGWWLTGAAVLAALLAHFLPWEGYGLIVSLPIAIIVLGLWLEAFVITAVVQHSYRNDALRYADNVKQRQVDWQVRRWQKAALVEGVVIGDTRSSSENRQSLVDPEHQPVKPKKTPDWMAIDFAPLSGMDTAERERELARLLVMRWHEQQAKPVVLHHCVAIGWALSLPGKSLSSKWQRRVRRSGYPQSPNPGKAVKVCTRSSISCRPHLLTRAFSVRVASRQRFGKGIACQQGRLRCCGYSVRKAGCFSLGANGSLLMSRALLRRLRCRGNRMSTKPVHRSLCRSTSRIYRALTI